jgi:hypothetical protein
VEAELDRVASAAPAPDGTPQRPDRARSRGAMPRLITLLTDFGTADGYVGEM